METLVLKIFYTKTRVSQVLRFFFGSNISSGTNEDTLRGITVDV